MKQLGQRVPVRQGRTYRLEEDSHDKKRTRPRSTGASSNRPSLFGFARPAGPEHEPKETAGLSNKFGSLVFLF